MRGCEWQQFLKGMIGEKAEAIHGTSLRARSVALQWRGTPAGITQSSPSTFDEPV